jgi:hypothetical protein
MLGNSAAIAAYDHELLADFEDFDEDRSAACDYAFWMLLARPSFEGTEQHLALPSGTATPPEETSADAGMRRARALCH